VIKTPVGARNANAVAERMVRSIRAECLDRLLILNRAHLTVVLKPYSEYYTHRRPHQGLGQRTPVPIAPSARASPIKRRDVLGGLIHEYDRKAA
jgi:putative transposase